MGWNSSLNNNIKYYNDTIATIPEATINCLKAYTDVDTLIFGGQDRGINYDNLINNIAFKELMEAQYEC